MREQARQNSSYLDLRIVNHGVPVVSFTKSLFFVWVAGHPLRLVKKHHLWLETANIRDQYSFLLITVLNRHLRWQCLCEMLHEIRARIADMERKEAKRDQKAAEERLEMKRKMAAEMDRKMAEMGRKVGRGTKREGENNDNINEDREKARKSA